MISAILNFLTAGCLDRHTANKIIQKASSQEALSKEKLEVAQSQACADLAMLEEQRQKLLESTVRDKIKLYELIGEDTNSTAITPETIYLKNAVPTVENMDKVPSALLRMGIGVVIGLLASVGGFTIVAALGLEERSAQINEILWLPPLLFGLYAGQRQGRKKLLAASTYGKNVMCFAQEAEAFIVRVPTVRKGAELSSLLIGLLNKRVLDKKSELMPILTDATNSAVLLREVLGTPLINEEGALMEQVIDQLHAQRQRIAEHRASIASVPA